MRVAVIGAGFSGLLVANGLTGRGIHCDIFEKSRGLGGRLSRRQTDWGNLDIGAPYFNPHHPQVIEFFQSRVSCGHCQTHSLSKASWQSDGIRAVDIETVFVAPDSNNRLCHDLAVGLNPHRNCRIDRISPTDRGMFLYSNGGEFGPFDAVVISVPAQQCQTLLPEPSPLRQQALPDLQPGWTLQLQLEATDANKLEHWGLLDFHGAEGLDRLTALSALPGRSHQNCFQLRLRPELCRQLKNLDDATAVEDILRRFTTLVGLNREAVPHSSLQRWNLGLSPDHIEQIAVEDRINRLVIAGDWTAGGGIDGAWLSANRAIDTLCRWV